MQDVPEKPLRSRTSFCSHIYSHSHPHAGPGGAKHCPHPVGGQGDTPQHRPQQEPAEASCSSTAPGARGSSQLLETWQRCHRVPRQQGLSPHRSLSGTGTVTHSLQLTHSPTGAGNSHGTPSVPSTAQSDGSMTPPSGAELGLRVGREMPSCPHRRQSHRVPGACAQPGTHRPCVQGSRGAGPQPRTTAAAGSLPTSS